MGSRRRGAIEMRNLKNDSIINNTKKKIPQNRLFTSRRFGMFSLMVTPFGWVFLFTILPMIIVMLMSFWRVESFQIVQDWNVNNYIRTIHTASFRRLLLRTFWNALIVGIGAVTLGYPLAYFITRIFKGNRIVFFILILLPLWVSYLLRVYSWRVILGRNGLINSFLIWVRILNEPATILLFNNFSVTLVLVYIALPFAFIPIYTSLEKIPSNLEEASKDLGAGGFKTFSKIIFPLSLPGVVTGGAYALIIGFGDYITPNLVGGTVGYRLSNAIEKWFGSANNWPFGSAQAVLMLIVIIILLTLILLSGGVKAIIEE
jgi:spermidine/putrescine transport system permease protein